MTREDFRRLETAQDWSAAFEVILRFYGEGPAPEQGIWGDKTPSYVLEMDLLKQIFPAARFVHIIRDPRDVALSAQRAWGHNPLRTAAKWARGMAAARSSAGHLGGSYLEVFYERLLAAPEQELRRISGFLGQVFEAEMTTLAAPSENIGSTRGKLYVDAANARKYRTEMPRRVQKRVEEIVWDAAQQTPYIMEYAHRPRPLARWARGCLALADGGKSFVHKVRRKGIVNGIRISIGNRLQKRRSP